MMVVSADGADAADFKTSICIGICGIGVICG
jgi:hypothetical protein